MSSTDNLFIPLTACKRVVVLSVRQACSIHLLLVTTQEEGINTGSKAPSSCLCQLHKRQVPTQGVQTQTISDHHHHYYDCRTLEEELTHHNIPGHNAEGRARSGQYSDMNTLECFATASIVSDEDP